MKRTTIYDIAQRLNISTATVNRALSGKPRVKEETRALVIRTAEEMGFKPNRAAQSLASRPMRLAVVAHTSFPEFHNAFLHGARIAAEELMDYNVQVDYFKYDRDDSNSEAALAHLDGTLEHIAGERYDGVLILALERRAGFERLRDCGVVVATAVNDVSPELRAFSVTYDGFTGGRIAAELLYQCMQDRGRPVAIASGPELRGIHGQTVQGFRKQLGAMPLNLVRVYDHRDNVRVAYAETCHVLDAYPDLGGIYVNSFNSHGILQALQARGLAGKVLLVTSDYSVELDARIGDGTVLASIFQNQFEQGKQGVRMLFEKLMKEAVPEIVRIDPQIVLNSNLALYRKSAQ